MSNILLHPAAVIANIINHSGPSHDWQKNFGLTTGSYEVTFKFGSYEVTFKFNEATKRPLKIITRYNKLIKRQLLNDLYLQNHYL